MIRPTTGSVFRMKRSGSMFDRQPEDPGIDWADDLLAPGLLNDKRRVELIERIFRDRVAEGVEGLLAVMARNGRWELLGAVAGQFRTQLNRREGKLEVEVTTAVPLSKKMERVTLPIILCLVLIQHHLGELGRRYSLVMMNLQWVFPV